MITGSCLSTIALLATNALFFVCLYVLTSPSRSNFYQNLTWPSLASLINVTGGDGPSNSTVIRPPPFPLGAAGRVVVISACLPPTNASTLAPEWSYVFYAPIVAEAWIRVRLGGRDTPGADVAVLVVLVGSRREWEERPAAALALSRLDSLARTTNRVKSFFLCDGARNNSDGEFAERDYGKHDVMLSQVSRLYAAPILRQMARSSPPTTSPSALDDVWVTTSDADLLPVHGAARHVASLSRDAVVHIFEPPDCCGNFRHAPPPDRFRRGNTTSSLAAAAAAAAKNATDDDDGDSYKMHAMAYISMTVRGWMDVMRFGDARFNLTNNSTAGDADNPEAISTSLPEDNVTPQFILNDVERMFGPMARNRVVHEKSQNWFLDQLYVSVMIGEFLRSGKLDGSRYRHKLRFVPRHLDVDRFDRAQWSWHSRPAHLRMRSVQAGADSSRLGGGVVDAHMPRHGYLKKAWKDATVHVVAELLGVEAARTLGHYRRLFVQMLGSERRDVN